MAVPSAQAGLTTLFGMERGGPYRHSHQKLLIDFTRYNIFLNNKGIKKENKKGIIIRKRVNERKLRVISTAWL